MNTLGLTLEATPHGLVPQPAKLLSVRQIELFEPQLAKELGLDPARHRSVGLLTCDSDDALYVALDQATKDVEVDIVFGKSFYAGARHASGPLSGEVLGIVAGEDPDLVGEALWRVRELLAGGVCFHAFEADSQHQFFAYVMGETGRYLAPQAGLPVGAPMAYLIAPPLESFVGLDAALKAAPVKLAKHLPPPSETNFAGGYLSGELADLEAASVAFVEAIRSVWQRPMAGLRRPERWRR